MLTTATQTEARATSSELTDGFHSVIDAARQC